MELGDGSCYGKSTVSLKFWGGQQGGEVQKTFFFRFIYLFGERARVKEGQRGREGILSREGKERKGGNPNPR